MDRSITAYSGFPSRTAEQHAAIYMTVQVQHYGYEFMYGANTVNPQKRMGALPSWLDPILLRIAPFVPVRAAGLKPSAPLRFGPSLVGSATARQAGWLAVMSTHACQ